MNPAVILGAGLGRRMGGPKAALEWNGETLLRRAVRVAREAGWSPVVAVVGAGAPGEAEVIVVHNQNAAEGMASSIRTGLAALPQESKRVLLMTVDQVAVDAPLLRNLLALSEVDEEQPVACLYEGTMGVPAVFPRRLFPALRALEGDRGAKAILFQEKTTTLPFPAGGADLDTPEDLRR
jgi:molybdenum cofactor cytidylyltransferase